MVHVLGREREIGASILALASEMKARQLKKGCDLFSASQAQPEKNAHKHDREEREREREKRMGLLFSLQ
jgi:hypothetical protein